MRRHHPAGRHTQPAAKEPPMSADVWVVFRLAVPMAVYMSEESAMRAKFHSDTVARYAPAAAAPAVALHAVPTDDAKEAA